MNSNEHEQQLEHIEEMMHACDGVIERLGTRNIRRTLRRRKLEEQEEDTDA